MHGLGKTDKDKDKEGDKETDKETDKELNSNAMTINDNVDPNLENAIPLLQQPS